MLLIPLVCGLLDFGMLWQKHQSAESAVRQGARRAAANCLESLTDPLATCKNGSQEEDDANALLSVISALGSADEIEKVVVFNADGSSVTDLNGTPPPGCMEAVPPMGVATKCNVYGPAELAGITTLNAAGLKARFNCGAASASAPWCPTTRVRSSANPAYVGVAIVVRHQHITGMFGSSAPVKTQAIFRLEPNTYSPIAVYEPDALFAAMTSTTTTTTSSTTTTTTIEPTPNCPQNGLPMTVAACTAITPTTTTTTTTTIAAVTTTTTRPPRPPGGNL